MDPIRFFPPAVREALAYEAPGTWMPTLPPGCIRLSAGYPFPDSVPSIELGAATVDLITAESDRPFHYMGSPSAEQLTALLAARSAARGMAVGPGELLVTAGASQALDLVARALLGPTDLVAVEAPTYMEALEVFRNYTPHIVGYGVDGGGLQVEALANDLADRRAKGLPLPRLLYTIASFQNPTGATLSLARRQRLLELAETYDFLILEDDAYGELAYEEVPVPLKALDRTDRVIYVGSLSKVIAPGLRIGWITAHAQLIFAMNLFKKDLDHSFVQAVAARYLLSIDLGARIAHLRDQYRERRDFMLTVLRQHLPSWVTFTEPQGGFFVWLRAPGINTVALLPKALAAGVSYVPGKYFFFADGEGGKYLRLSFSYLPPAEIERGVKLLSGVLGAHATPGP